MAPPRSPARQALADRGDPQALPAYVARYLEWLRVHNYAEPTVKNRELYLEFFVAWAAERGLTLAREITNKDEDITSRSYDELMPMFSDDGKFNPKALATLAASYVELQLLPQAPDMAKLYTEAFLPK